MPDQLVATESREGNTADPVMDQSTLDANLRNFETAMNYHERLKEKKGEAAQALFSSNVITQQGADVLVEAIGSDKHLMRQLASVFQKGYYADDVWMTQLKNKVQQEGWLLRFDENDNIEIDNDKTYIKELFTLLQNKRVSTVVDNQVFDVDGELIALSR